MRKRIILLTMCLGLAVSSISACKPAEQTQEYAKEQKNEDVEKDICETDKWIENPVPKEAMKYLTSEEEEDYISTYEKEMFINTMEACEPLNMTAEQKLEDFDYFWDMIQEKVYCLDELAKERGINLEQHLADYREKIEKSENDLEFYRVLTNSASIFKGMWHISVQDPDGELYEVAEKYLSLEDPEEKDIYYKEVVNGTIAKKSKYWDVLLKQNDNLYGTRKNLVINDMPELEILNDKTAVIKIPTMAYYSKRKAVGEHLTELMKEVSDYENVIFDLNSNTGGWMSWAWNSIIAPNIDEPLTFSDTVFFKNTEDVQKYRKTYREPGTMQEDYVKYTQYPDMLLSELPEQMKIENGEYGNADFFGRDDIEILPKYNQKILKGKIWVLSYKINYSAADIFVNTCKKTGFATVVGKQTSGAGDTNGLYYFKLPNSGLEGRTGYAWRLNEDGTNNENEGVKPDIESPENETPLQTCLRIIEEESRK